MGLDRLSRPKLGLLCSAWIEPDMRPAIHGLALGGPGGVPFVDEGTPGGRSDRLAVRASTTSATLRPWRQEGCRDRRDRGDEPVSGGAGR
jgi:hypothetical protein